MVRDISKRHTGIHEVSKRNELILLEFKLRKKRGRDKCWIEIHTKAHKKT